MKIGVISDTHGHFHPKILTVFAGADLIVHAGDIGSREIISRLETVAPVRAVFGNMDGHELRQNYPERDTFSVDGMTMLLIHDVGNINHFLSLIQKGAISPRPAVVIFGHTHQAFFQQLKGVYFINPGSAALPRASKKPTVLTLTVAGKSIREHRLISL